MGKFRNNNGTWRVFFASLVLRISQFFEDYRICKWLQFKWRWLLISNGRLSWNFKPPIRKYKPFIASLKDIPPNQNRLQVKYGWKIYFKHSGRNKTKQQARICFVWINESNVNKSNVDSTILRGLQFLGMACSIILFD